MDDRDEAAVSRFMNAVRTCMLLLFLLGSWVPAAFSQTPVPYEKVLFPIVTLAPIPGAGGSQWMTEHRVLNCSASEVTLYGTYTCMYCSPKYGPERFLPGITYATVAPLGAYGIPGSFLFVDRTAVSNVAFALRVRDVSRSDRGFGTEIPVVREREFSDRITPLGVPVDARYRRMLRVYALDSQGGTFQVRVFVEARSTPGPAFKTPDGELGAEMFSMIVPDTTNSDRENYPAYAGITEIPFIETANEVDTLRVEITPITPGLRLWAFVSVTNNETQEVTIVSPQ